MGYNCYKKKNYNDDYVSEFSDYMEEYNGEYCTTDSSVLFDEEYDDSIYDDELDSHKKELHTIDSIEYDSVTTESLDILDSVDKKEKKKHKKKSDSTDDLFFVNADTKKKKTQSDIDREIVEKFYENPTPERFSLIWKRFYYGVHSHACKLMGTWERADDMVQETFQRAWEKRDSFDVNKGNYSTWIYRICFNVCATNLKQNAKKRSVDVDINDLFDNVAYSGVVDSAITDNVYYTLDDNGNIIQSNFEEIQRRIYDTSLNELQQMDSTFCQIMTMKDIENKTLAQIAKELDMKESKVKNIYYANRAVLGERIKEKYSDLYNTYREAKHDMDESEDVFGPAYSSKTEDTVDDYAYYTTATA